MLPLSALSLLAALTLCAPPATVAGGTLTTTVIGDSTGLGSVTEGDMLNHGRKYWVEPRTASFARILPAEGGRRVVHNGVEGPVFPAIAGMTFSPDGSRLTYVGRTQEGERLVVDGEVLASFGRRAPRLVQLPFGIPKPLRDPNHAIFARYGFSDDGQHLAWVQNTGATEGPGYRVMLDGETVADAERVAFIGFAPDGEFVWSSSSHDAAGSLVVGDAVGPSLIAIDGLAFAGSSFNYTGLPAGGGQRQYLVNHEVVVDPARAPYAERRVLTDGVVYSEDLNQVAVLLAAEVEGEAPELLLDGTSLGPVREGSVVEFDSLGRLFYQRANGQVVLGDEARGEFPTVMHAAFAPAGDAMWFLAVEDGALFAINERGTRIGPFEHGGELGFSADGAHSALVTGAPGAAQDLFVDGQLVLASPVPIREARFAEFGDALFINAPDLEDAAWSAALEQLSGRGPRLVRVPPVRVPAGALSPDGRTYAHIEVQTTTVAERMVKSFELVVNGESTGESFDQAPAGFAFGDDGVLRFVSRRGTEVLRVEYRP